MAPGGTLDLSDRDDRMGAKIKTQKIHRASKKPQKIPGLNINRSYETDAILCIKY